MGACGQIYVEALSILLEIGGIETGVLGRQPER
jgi:hypothetical protein